MGYGTTIDERIFEIEGLRNIVIAQREYASPVFLSFFSFFYQENAWKLVHWLGSVRSSRVLKRYLAPE